MGLLPSSHQRIAPYQQFSSQNPSSFPSHSSLSSSQYRDYYYNNSNHYYIPAPTSYFISLEPISAPSSNHRNTIKTSNSLPFYQHQERPWSVRVPGSITPSQTIPCLCLVVKQVAARLMEAAVRLALAERSNNINALFSLSTFALSATFPISN